MARNPIQQAINPIQQVIQEWIQFDLSKWHYNAMQFYNFWSDAEGFICIPIYTKTMRWKLRIGTIILQPDVLYINYGKFNQKQLTFNYNDPNFFQNVENGIKLVYNYHEYE